jgi:hypothetical protein
MRFTINRYRHHSTEPEPEQRGKEHLMIERRGFSPLGSSHKAVHARQAGGASMPADCGSSTTNFTSETWFFSSLLLLQRTFCSLIFAMGGYKPSCNSRFIGSSSFPRDGSLTPTLRPIRRCVISLPSLTRMSTEGDMVLSAMCCGEITPVKGRQQSGHARTVMYIY